MYEAKELNNVVSNKHSLGMWIASAWLTFFFVSFVTWSLIPSDIVLLQMESDTCSV